MLDPEFLSMMAHTVRITKTVSRDEWGNKLGGAIHVVPARIIGKRRKVLSTAGEEVISETTVYMATTSGFTPDDVITMPSGYLPLQPEIISVTRQSDERGLHHTVIYA